MRKLLTICVALIVSVAFCASPANAAISYGTPSPSLSPTFGTLVDFDDQATGTPVLAGDYAAQGVASIIELTGGILSRYPGSQSSPNYIGTGVGYEIWGDPQGWDGVIRIDLASPASLIGIGVANSIGAAEVISVYDSGGTLLESHTLRAGVLNDYVLVFGVGPISRIEVNGDFFSLDDLQFGEGISVDIDIKPGSCPNPFNAKSKGSVPVAIVGTADLDVTMIDPTSLKLNGVPIVPENVLVADVTEPGGDNTDCYTCFEEPDPIYDAEGNLVWEYLGDGYDDLIVKFDTEALAAAIGAAERDECVTLALTGETMDGFPIVGSDSMVIKTKIK